MQMTIVKRILIGLATVGILFGVTFMISYLVARGTKHETVMQREDAVREEASMRHRQNAFDIAKRELASTVKQRGPDDVEVAWKLQALADAGYDLLWEDYDDTAISMYERAIEIIDEHRVTEDSRVIDVLLNLEDIYFRQKRYEDQEPLLKRALSGYEKTYGAKNIYVTVPLSRLAVVYTNQRRFRDAEASQKRVVGIFEDLAVQDSHLMRDTGFVEDRAFSYRNFAKIYTKQERYADAELLLLRALKIIDEFHGNEDIAAYPFIEDLETVNRKLGRFPEADKYAARASRIRRALNSSSTTENKSNDRDAVRTAKPLLKLFLIVIPYAVIILFALWLKRRKETAIVKLMRELGGTKEGSWYANAGQWYKLRHDEREFRVSTIRNLIKVQISPIQELLLRGRTRRDDYGIRIGLNSTAETGDPEWDGRFYMEYSGSRADVLRIFARTEVREHARLLFDAGAAQINFGAEMLVTFSKAPTRDSIVQIMAAMATIGDNLPRDLEPPRQKTFRAIASEMALLFTVPPSMIGLIASTTTFEPIDGSPYHLALGGAIAIWICAVITRFRFGKKSATGLRDFFLFAALTLVVFECSAQAGAFFINGYFDISEPAHHEVHSMTSPNGRHTILSTWKEGETEFDLPFRGGYFSNMEPGVPFVVTTRAGFLGWEWFVNAEPMNLTQAERVEKEAVMREQKPLVVASMVFMVLILPITYGFSQWRILKKMRVGTIASR